MARFHVCQLRAGVNGMPKQAPPKKIEWLPFFLSSIECQSDSQNLLFLLFTLRIIIVQAIFLWIIVVVILVIGVLAIIIVALFLLRSNKWKNRNCSDDFDQKMKTCAVRLHAHHQRNVYGNINCARYAHRQQRRSTQIPHVADNAKSRKKWSSPWPRIRRRHRQRLCSKTCERLT